MAVGEGTQVSSGWAMLDALNDAVVVADRTGLIAHVNPAVFDLLGWQPAELVGLPVMTLVPERTRGAHLAGFDRYFATGVARILGQPLEVTAVNATGVEQPIELVLSAVDIDGERLVIGTIRDVRERLDLERRSALTHQVLRVAAGTDTVEQFTARLLEALGTELGLGATGLWSPESSGRALTLRGMWQAGTAGSPLSVASSQVRFRRGEGLPGRVWASGQPAWIADLATDDSFSRGGAAINTGLRSAFAFPLVAADGVVAVFELFSSESQPPDNGLLSSMMAICGEVGEIWQRRVMAERENEVSERERAVAQTLQRALLPPALADVPGLQVSVRFVPGGDLVIGGDFYDLFALPDVGPAATPTWALAVGDVCGTGPEAAAVTAKVRNSARALLRTGNDLDAVYDYLNRALAERGEDRFCTAVFGLVAPQPDGSMRFLLCNAGHPPPLVARLDGTVEVVRPHGLPLGIDETGSCASETVLLHRGETLLLYTDGITEARCGRDQYGYDRLIRMFGDAAPNADVDELTARIVADVDGFRSDAHSDDVVLLALRVPSSPT